MSDNRQNIIEESACMIGRNIYSQSLRTYAINPYKDGKYYSDCSSFVSAAYKCGGYDIGWQNSSSFKTHSKFYSVDIKVDGKHIVNPEKVLQIADVICWNGHVEMVHSIKNEVVYVQGHGDDVPKIRKLYDVEKWNSGTPVVKRLKEFQNITSENKTLYCVQCGAYSNKIYALYQQKMIEEKGFKTYVPLGEDGLYRIQIGAFSVKKNAEECLKKVHEAGFTEAYVKVK